MRHRPQLYSIESYKKVDSLNVSMMQGKLRSIHGYQGGEIAIECVEIII